MEYKGRKVYVQHASPYLGCDPELFLTRNGQTVGSEKLIGETGINGAAGGGGSVVPDGVQIELHPSPSTCRQSLAYFIGHSMALLEGKLKEMKDLKLSFDAVVTVSKEELDTLSEKSKVFGCAPSLNAYGSEGKEITINAATYLKRHAGGHLHFGLVGWQPHAKAWNERPRLARILDALVGNTCVLIDRDPEAAERRQHYGRAGEFRLPKHGFEYRTLSNFWMRSYQLMSFVFGVGRQGVGVWSGSLLPTYVPGANPYQPDLLQLNWEEDLFKLVDPALVEKAINTNDLELAYKNWEGVAKFFTDNFAVSHSGLTSSRIKPFEFFARKIQEEGLQYWFKDDPFHHWTSFAHSVAPADCYGWERYCDETISARMRT